MQWLTPHLASLGAVEVSRREYLARLDAALRTTTRPFDERRATGCVARGYRSVIVVTAGTILVND